MKKKQRKRQKNKDWMVWMGELYNTKNPTGKLRSEQCRIMKYEWGVNGGLNEEQLDKVKYLEKKYGKRHYTQKEIDKVK